MDPCFVMEQICVFLCLKHGKHTSRVKLNLKFITSWASSFSSILGTTTADLSKLNCFSKGEIDTVVVHSLKHIQSWDCCEALETGIACQKDTCLVLDTQDNTTLIRLSIEEEWHEERQYPQLDCMEEYIGKLPQIVTPPLLLRMKMERASQDIKH